VSGDAALPSFYREPQLATPADRAPAGADWLHEIKYDGYRLTCVVTGRRVRLITRGGKDWTERFADVAACVADLGVTEAAFDGEVAVVRPDGRTSFQDLQNHLGGQTGGVLRYFVFDLTYVDGQDLGRLPLEERKARLEGVLSALPPDTLWRFGDHIVGRGPEFFREACSHSLEGIISKRRSAPYRTGRSSDWLKVKCMVEDDFIVIGYTEPGGSREGFGALLLSRPDGEGGLVFAGRVGTGFSGRRIARLMSRLTAIEREDPACAGAPSGRAAREMHWVEPELIVRVAFTGWTADRVLRHASFKGLREDVEASDLVSSPGPESASPASVPSRRGGPRRPGVAPPRARGGAQGAAVAVWNPAQVLVPQSGVKKQEVAG
jgi:bifunctional non-homologous end joining protein LigD